MSVNLKNLTKLSFRFAPWENGCKSIREFLSRCTAPKATASNAECEIDVKIRAKGDPYVDVVFAGGKAERIETKDKKVGDILGTIQQKTEEMETQNTLKAAGLKDGEKLESSW
ncbi:hypothetical protein BSKO_01751 [Bryopsis sp. KO-2023]|nr:hypothetical protein BSKO_01751 [Bryopsis sp. KO-2023]